MSVNRALDSRTWREWQLVPTVPGVPEFNNPDHWQLNRTAYFKSGGINNLLDDPTRREQMSQYGAERVRDKLVWQHSVPPLLAAYDVLFARSDPLARTLGTTSNEAPTKSNMRGDRSADSSVS